MQPQYSQGAAPSHHPPPYAPPEVSQASGGSITSSLRQWRKKDYLEKQQTTEQPQTSVAENPSHVARVAPHTYYPRLTNDVCNNYQHQYTEYGVPYKPPAPTPVKYSEIVDTNPQAQTIEHITPVIPKLKDKEFGDLCSVPPQPHLKQYQDQMTMKQSYPDGTKQTYSDPTVHHQYISKESQIHPFLQKQSQMHQYIQKEPYQQFIPKYGMQGQYPQSYPSEPNNFLAHLNKINPRMAQSIINDTHLRDPQIPMYHSLEQNRSYPQPQRMYHAPSMHSSPPTHAHRNIPPSYNYAQPYNYNVKSSMQPNDPYNRVHQYQHNVPKYLPEYKMNAPIEQPLPNISPQRMYNESVHMNYAPMPPKISPNYPHCSQLEYAQHYQHRRAHLAQEYYNSHSAYKSAYVQNPQVSPEGGVSDGRTRKSSLKQYLETWVEEDMSGNLPDLVVSNNLNDDMENLKDTTEIPNETLPHFLHLQQFEKLPDNIRGYYTCTSAMPTGSRRIIIENNGPEGLPENNQVIRGNSAPIVPKISEGFTENNGNVVAIVNQNAAENQRKIEETTVNMGRGFENPIENLENKVVQIHIVEDSEATSTNSSNSSNDVTAALNAHLRNTSSPSDTVIIQSNVFPHTDQFTKIIGNDESCVTKKHIPQVEEEENSSSSTSTQSETNIQSEDGIKNMPVIDESVGENPVNEITEEEIFIPPKDTASNHNNVQETEISEDLQASGNASSRRSSICSIYKEMEHIHGENNNMEKSKESENVSNNLDANQTISEQENCKNSDNNSAKTNDLQENTDEPRSCVINIEQSEELNAKDKHSKLETVYSHTSENCDASSNGSSPNYPTDLTNFSNLEIPLCASKDKVESETESVEMIQDSVASEVQETPENENHRQISKKLRTKLTTPNIPEECLPDEKNTVQELLSGSEVKEINTSATELFEEENVKNHNIVEDENDDAASTAGAGSTASALTAAAPFEDNEVATLIKDNLLLNTKETNHTENDVSNNNPTKIILQIPNTKISRNCAINHQSSDENMPTKENVFNKTIEAKPSKSSEEIHYDESDHPKNLSLLPVEDAQISDDYDDDDNNKKDNSILTSNFETANQIEDMESEEETTNEPQNEESIIKNTPLDLEKSAKDFNQEGKNLIEFENFNNMEPKNSIESIRKIPVITDHCEESISQVEDGFKNTENVTYLAESDQDDRFLDETTADNIAASPLNLSVDKKCVDNQPKPKTTNVYKNYVETSPPLLYNTSILDFFDAKLPTENDEISKPENLSLLVENDKYNDGGLEISATLNVKSSKKHTKTKATSRRKGTVKKPNLHLLVKEKLRVAASSNEENSKSECFNLVPKGKKLQDVVQTTSNTTEFENEATSENLNPVADTENTVKLSNASNDVTTPTEAIKSAPVEEEISKPVNFDSLENNSNNDSLENNSNDVSLENNSNDDSLESNSNDDSLENNSDDVLLENNSNDDSLENNSNDVSLENNSNDDSLESNSNDDSLENNSDDVSLENNSNDDSLENNTNYVSLENNSNDDSLENNSDDVSLENNLNDDSLENNSNDVSLENNSHDDSLENNSNNDSLENSNSNEKTEVDMPKLVAVSNTKSNTETEPTSKIEEVPRSANNLTVMNAENLVSQSEINDSLNTEPTEATMPILKCMVNCNELESSRSSYSVKNNDMNLEDPLKPTAFSNKLKKNNASKSKKTNKTEHLYGSRKVTPQKKPPKTSQKYKYKEKVSQKQSGLPRKSRRLNKDSVPIIQESREEQQIPMPNLVKENVLQISEVVENENLQENILDTASNNNIFEITHIEEETNLLQSADVEHQNVDFSESVEENVETDFCANNIPEIKTIEETEIKNLDQNDSSNDVEKIIEEKNSQEALNVPENVPIEEANISFQENEAEEDLQESEPMIATEQTISNQEEDCGNNDTSIVYQINDTNVVLQIADELLEINVITQNGRKIISVKTFSDAIIMNNSEETNCQTVEDTTVYEDSNTNIDQDQKLCENATPLNNNYIDISNAPNLKNTNADIEEEACFKEICTETDITTVGDDVFIYNEEVVSSSTETETVSKLPNKEEQTEIATDDSDKIQKKYLTRKSSKRDKKVSWEDEKLNVDKIKCLTPSSPKKPQKDEVKPKIEPNISESSSNKNPIIKDSLRKCPKTKAALKFVETIKPTKAKIKEFKVPSKTTDNLKIHTNIEANNNPAASDKNVTKLTKKPVGQNNIKEVNRSDANIKSAPKPKHHSNKTESHNNNNNKNRYDLQSKIEEKMEEIHKTKENPPNKEEKAKEINLHVPLKNKRSLSPKEEKNKSKLSQTPKKKPKIDKAEPQKTNKQTKVQGENKKSQKPKEISLKNIKGNIKKENKDVVRTEIIENPKARKEIQTKKTKCKTSDEQQTKTCSKQKMQDKKEDVKNEEPTLEEKQISVQENSITSSTSQESEASIKQRSSKLIQQITDDWDDDSDDLKTTESACKRRLSLQEYNSRKRTSSIADPETIQPCDLNKTDLTDNLFGLIGNKSRREISPESPILSVKFNNKTYSRNSNVFALKPIPIMAEQDTNPKETNTILNYKTEEPLSSAIELHLPRINRSPRPAYNQEYLRNALMNDLQAVNAYTTTLIKENQQLMQRFLEQKRLTADELKKVKTIIRYKRLVQHLSTIKINEMQTTTSVREGHTIKLDTDNILYPSTNPAAYLKLTSKFNCDVNKRQSNVNQIIIAATSETSSKVNQLHSEETVKLNVEKRKKKRFRFLYSDEETEPHKSSDLSATALTNSESNLKKPRLDNSVPELEKVMDYSVHQSNSQGQLTLVFKRSFKSDPKMQPFVRLERLPSIDLLAKNRLY